MAWFRFPFRGKAPAVAELPHVRFVLYTRRGCHLCEDAYQILLAEQRRYRFDLELIDVDTDRTLAELHGEHVPVVSVDGKTRFRGAVNRVLLERLLVAAVR